MNKNTCVVILLISLEKALSVINLPSIPVSRVIKIESFFTVSKEPIYVIFYLITTFTTKKYIISGGECTNLLTVRTEVEI
ncbi:MAG TPA: hypothetical protein PKJ95_01945 [Atribacterota bacterium]|nr:hypothetical protein [Atribacterota bacterium]